jgi:hypothetical protein
MILTTSVYLQPTMYVTSIVVLNAARILVFRSTYVFVRHLPLVPGILAYGALMPALQAADARPAPEVLGAFWAEKLGKGRKQIEEEAVES